MRSTTRQLLLATMAALAMAGPAQAEPQELQPPGLTLRFEFGGAAGQPHQVYANGMPLRAPQPGPLRAKEESGSGAAGVILAIGVALALVVLVSGEVAEDITGKDDDGSGNDEECRVPGAGGDCAIGGDTGG